MDNKYTYIISDKIEYNELANLLSINVIQYEAYDKDYKIHDWLTQEFKSKEIDRIIIPLSLGNNETEGLNLILHHRLNYEISIEKRLVPVVVLSNLTMENILTKCVFDSDNNTQNLLLTDGISVSSTDVEDIEEKLNNTNSIPVERYQSFLNKMNVNRKSTYGHHDIANAWGCFKLAQVVENKDDICKKTRFKDTIFQKDSVSRYVKQMYAKYLICKNESYGNDYKLERSQFDCRKKKILLIDDKSDEGWGELMNYIFRNGDFVYIDSSKYKKDGFDYNGFSSECRLHIGKQWDLIIIDLRLNPQVEDMDDNNIRPKELSGYKLIDDFLNNNPGYQIIVLTASNKIWNINEALKRGAKSYYIKESPDFNNSITETKIQYDLFKREATKCFENAYLQDIYKSTCDIKNKIRHDENKEFANTLSKQLDLSFFLISKAEKGEEYAFAYVSLYQIIEIITSEYIIREEIFQKNVETNDSEPTETDEVLKQTNSKVYRWKFKKSGVYLNDYNFDPNTQTYIYNSVFETNNDKTPCPQWKQMAGLIYQEWNCQSSDACRLVWSLRHLIEKRNGFIHNDKSILDKQNEYGKYLHHDIYEKSGFENLFKTIKEICDKIL